MLRSIVSSVTIFLPPHKLRFQLSALIPAFVMSMVTNIQIIMRAIIGTHNQKKRYDLIYSLLLYSASFFVYTAADRLRPFPFHPMEVFPRWSNTLLSDDCRKEGIEMEANVEMLTL